MSDQAVLPLSPPELPDDPVVMTRDGFERLEARLAQLTTVERPALLKQIQQATLFTTPGTDAASVHRYDLALVDQQIAYLEGVLGQAQVIQSRSDANTVQPGSAVTVRYGDGTEDTLTLVGPLEVDLERGRVSMDSAVGQALLGAAPGADVTVGEGDEAMSLSVVAIGKPDSSTSSIIAEGS